MKNWLIAALLACSLASAQDDGSKNPMAEQKNEVRADVLSLVAFGKATLAYERFLGDNLSVGLSGTFSFSNKIDEDFDSGYRNTLPKFEAVPYVRYRLSNSFSNYYFIEAFVSANGGDFREIVREESAGVGTYRIDKQEYFDLAIGGSLGYKVYFQQKWALEVLVGAGYNLIDPDKSPEVIARVGLSLGYRF